MYLLNLHRTPKGHLIKIRTFLQEIIEKKYTFARRFEWLKLNLNLLLSRFSLMYRGLYIGYLS